VKLKSSLITIIKRKKVAMLIEIGQELSKKKVFESVISD